MLDTLEAGDLIILPPYSHHGFKNVGDDILRVLAVFSSATAPTIFDDKPDEIVYIGGTEGDRLDSQRTVEKV
jgi:oxalate decarboxylase/phosphoglucose isomerase-like protein (cupin superfamily)